jgi:hypothetical protein
MECVNKRIEGRTSKEYYSDNKETLVAKSKQFYVNNKVKVNQYYKEYYIDSKKKGMRVCLCGVEYNSIDKTRAQYHYDSQRHTRYVLDLRERLSANFTLG